MPEKDGSWLLGVVICSKTGMRLVNACSDPPLRVRQLCRMLPALHSLAAGIVSPTSHLDLVTCSAALCESRVGYIVAALTTPGADWRQRRESASFVAETVSRAFAWHGGENLESFIARDMDDAVMDATDAGEDADVADTGDATTHPEFRSFELEYLRPALAREFAYNRAPHVRWLEPLVGCVSARVAHAHVLIPRSTTGPVTNDDVVDATRDDRDLDDSTSSDAIRAKELVSRATWECVVVASARGIEASDPLARLCDVDAVGCGDIWRETRARCLAMAESRARRCLATAEAEVGVGFGGHRPSPRAKGGGVVRGPFAKREASTPPETAVLVFRDARVGGGGGEGKREGEGGGRGPRSPGAGIGGRCERSYTRSRATRARRSGRRARWRSACRRRRVTRRAVTRRAPGRGGVHRGRGGPTRRPSLGGTRRKYPDTRRGAWRAARARPRASCRPISPGRCSGSPTR